MEGAASFPSIIIRGGLALSFMIARGGAPSKIVDQTEVGAPEDGSGMW